jgi:hypothetical protein
MLLQENASDIAKAIKAGKGKATLNTVSGGTFSNDARKRFNYYR